MTRKTNNSTSITRRRLLTTVGAGAVLALSPFRINLLQAQEATIKVGFPVPLTGPYGAEAQDQVRAAEVAIAEFNEGGGLNGRKAELLVRDDKLNPGEAATRTLELIEKETRLSATSLSVFARACSICASSNRMSPAASPASMRRTTSPFFTAVPSAT